MIVERQEVAVACGRIQESEGVVSKDVPVLAEAELVIVRRRRVRGEQPGLE